MATFTDKFSITATLADGRQLTMTADTTHTITKVFDGTLDANDDALYGFTSAQRPNFDAEPVLLICQYQGNGLGSVSLTNTAAGVADFALRHGQSVQLHGTALFDTDASAVTATVTEEVEEFAIDGSSQGGAVRIISFM